MKQILQNLKNGQTILEEIPCPGNKPGYLMIRTGVSLVSTGTEKMLVDFGKANLIEKARRQPDKVRMVLDKVKTDGLLPTIEAVRSKLDQPLPMGYCNVGTVISVGKGVDGFSIGDRVVSNGKHAEVVVVPKHLCARVAEGVSDEAASFTVIGAIALEGIRLVQPALGEAVVVTGLGLIGLLAVQLLRAHGCRVLGIDVDAGKCAIARGFGAETVTLSRGEDPLAAASAFSRGRGVDAVLIAASTQSSEPVHQAALMCRKRGRIVLVGVTGLALSRADFYEKELSFQVSCSYGPGRYDPLYEEAGQDYPIGFVRWTEQRNFEAVLDMLAERRIDVDPLISHRFPLTLAAEAYEMVEKGGALGILLSYPTAAEKPAAELVARTLRLKAAPFEDVSHAGTATGKPAVVGFIGAGNYAGRVLMPAFQKAGAEMHTVATSGGVSGAHFGKKFGFSETTTDVAALLEDDRINTIVVATRHNTHAHFVIKALEAGKHVFVEKPLCLTEQELEKIIKTYSQRLTPNSSLLTPNASLLTPNSSLTVGFNRRFAPQVKKIKSLLEGVREPKTFVMTVNAGAIPADHWTQEPEVGGGRMIGEGCHFIDLLRFLAGAGITDVQAARMGKGAGIVIRDDKVTVTLTFADGSIGTVHYWANGHKSFPKERLEIFCAGRILQLDNFRRLKGFGWPGFRKMNLWRQDKGQEACAAAFLDSIRRGNPPPIPFDELVEVTRATIEVGLQFR